MGNIINLNNELYTKEKNRNYNISIKKNYINIDINKTLLLNSNILKKLKVNDILYNNNVFYHIMEINKNYMICNKLIININDFIKDKIYAYYTDDVCDFDRSKVIIVFQKRKNNEMLYSGYEKTASMEYKNQIKSNIISLFNKNEISDFNIKNEMKNINFKKNNISIIVKLSDNIYLYAYKTYKLNLSGKIDINKTILLLDNKLKILNINHSSIYCSDVFNRLVSKININVKKLFMEYDITYKLNNTNDNNFNQYWENIKNNITLDCKNLDVNKLLEPHFKCSSFEIYMDYFTKEQIINVLDEDIFKTYKLYDIENLIKLLNFNEGYINFDKNAVIFENYDGYICKTYKDWIYYKKLKIDNKIYIIKMNYLDREKIKEEYKVFNKLTN